VSLNDLIDSLQTRRTKVCSHRLDPDCKKLSDFFIGQKVPLHRKDQIPVLVNGNGDIIWVAGFRLDNRYKITPGTKKISIFELTEL
jgi:tRNA(Ile)-lysidine synthetase-like protein